MVDIDVKKIRRLKIGEQLKLDEVLYFWFGQQREKSHACYQANVEVGICFKAGTVDVV